MSIIENSKIMASACSENTIGWETLYVKIENDLQEKSDLIIALIHWILIFQKQFKCISHENDVSSYLNFAKLIFLRFL